MSENKTVSKMILNEESALVNTLELAKLYISTNPGITAFTINSFMKDVFEFLTSGEVPDR